MGRGIGVGPTASRMGRGGEPGERQADELLVPAPVTEQETGEREGVHTDGDVTLLGHSKVKARGSVGLGRPGGPSGSTDRSV